MVRIQLKAGKKAKIKERDGNQCVLCGNTKDLTIDHIIPIVRGGTNEDKNLRTLCLNCNKAKGHKHDNIWHWLRGIFNGSTFRFYVGRVVTAKLSSTNAYMRMMLQQETEKLSKQDKVLLEGYRLNKADLTTLKLNHVKLLREHDALLKRFTELERYLGLTYESILIEGYIKQPKKRKDKTNE